ncbi:mechanosensitive ion channel family protein [Balneola sp. MJW-20]|uniref:mechanosensitive ion channel family protein n=1 Tax=Gracilimonas aurantiaca TaxID=3234185 RepID=UPI0034675DEB
METIVQAFESSWKQIQESAPQLIAAFAVLIIFWLIGNGISRVIKKTLGTERKTLRKTNFLTRIARWTFNIIGLVAALHIIGLTELATSFLAAGGVAAVVLGFAFREIGENLLAGIFMSFSRSFEVGDVIESNGLRGTVKRINVRDVHIRTADGCDIYIPSAMIFKNPLLNFTKDGLRRVSFIVGLDYGDNLGEAQNEMRSKLEALDYILKDPEPKVELANFSSSYAEIEVFFWMNTFGSKETISQKKTRVMHECLNLLKNGGYTLSSEVTTAIVHSPVQVNLRKD